MGNLQATPLHSQPGKYPKANYPKANYPKAKYPKAKYPSPRPTPTRRVVNGSYHKPVVLHVTASHAVNVLPMAASHAPVNVTGTSFGADPATSNPEVIFDLPEGN